MSCGTSVYSDGKCTSATRACSSTRYKRTGYPVVLAVSTCGGARGYRAEGTQYLLKNHVFIDIAGVVPPEDSIGSVPPDTRCYP